MPKVKEIAQYFEQLVPNAMKQEFDNVGPLICIGDTNVCKAIVALDITDGVIEQAICEKAQIIISHHPLFFDLKQINDSSHIGARIVRLIQNGISALCLHTNLDQVKGGVNDTLAEKLGIGLDGILGEELSGSKGESYGMGRFGTLNSPMAMPDFCEMVMAALNAPGLRYLNAGKKAPYKVAVCGGTGGNYIDAAHVRGCDTLVTADIKHHEFHKAMSLGINVIDGGHYHTENVVVPVLADMLKKGFPELDIIISEAAVPPVHFMT